LSEINTANQEDGRFTRDCGKDQQQEEPTALCDLVSSTTTAENQYVEDANSVELSCEMAMETTRDDDEGIEEREMVQVWTSQIDNKTEAERNNEKLGKKHDKPKHSYDGGSTGKETDDYESEVGITLVLQPNSPKRSKKIKVGSDPQMPRERTFSKAGLKHLKDFNHAHYFSHKSLHR
jgi:hypothetical protein